MSHFRKFLPLVAFLLFGSITVILWQNQNKHERELVFKYTETSSNQIRIRIQGLMNARMAALELLAERWVQRVPPDFSRKRFLESLPKCFIPIIPASWESTGSIPRALFVGFFRKKAIKMSSIRRSLNLRIPGCIKNFVYFTKNKIL